MKFFIICFIVALVAVTAAVDECANANLYECPVGDTTVLIDNCMDCAGSSFADEQHMVCAERNLFSGDDHYHYLSVDIIGVVVWMVTAGIATACGVGGGGIYMPLGILLLGFGAKSSSGLSQASIFGASVGGLILNIVAKHPNTRITDSTVKKAEIDEKTTTFYSRPLIDYNMVLFLAPMEMAGATLGVLIQKVLPNWLYMGVASLVLGLTSWKTFQTFYKKRDKETAAAAAAVTAVDSDVSAEGNDGDLTVAKTIDIELAPATPKELGGSAKYENIAAADAVELTKEELATQIKFLEADSRQFPVRHLFALALLWVVMVLMTFLKGGKGVDSLVGVTCSDPEYPALVVIQFLWLFGFSTYYALSIVKGREERLAVQYPFTSTDVVWDKKMTLFNAELSFCAGIIAGLIGIGGGMVLGPLMIMLGIDARVSTAVTASMVVLTSSSVAVMYVITGYIPVEYFFLYFSVCLVGAYIGKQKIDAYVKKTNSASTLVFILASIIAFATVGCLVTLFIRLGEKNFCLDGFHDFCVE